MKNVEYRLQGKDSPGPGSYDQLATNSWNYKMHEFGSPNKNANTIPKSKRFT